MAKKDTNVPVEQCENMDMELLRRQMKRLEEALTAMKEEMSKMASPSQLPALIKPEPTPIELPEINIPDNLATAEDIKTMSDTIVKLNESLTLVVKGMAELKTAFENMPKPEDKTEEVAEKVAETTSDKVVSKLSDKIENAYVDAYARGKIKADGLSVSEATSINNRLSDMNDRLDIRDDRERLKSNSFILKVVVVTLLVLGVAGIKWIQILRQENKQLTRVEWLYRSLRATASTDNIQSMEKYMLYGTDEQRDSIKTIIVNAESSGPQLRFFQPHDDWKPKPPKEEKPKEVADTKTDVATTKDTIDYTLLPHKNPKRFTPGEIAAYKHLQNDPNIPEDARPPIPEGYE